VISIFRFLQEQSLNLSFSAYRLASSLDTARARDEIEAVDLLKGEVLHSLAHQKKVYSIDWLRNKLRNYPYWLKGHKSLAVASLELNDIASSYASAHAMLALARSKRSRTEAQKIMGKCYLRQGQAEKALKLFTTLNLTNPIDYEVTEDLAAASMALDRYNEAKTLLSSIPKDRLSKEGVSALEYLKNKLKS